MGAWHKGNRTAPNPIGGESRRRRMSLSATGQRLPRN
jgi:hypothetical protein